MRFALAVFIFLHASAAWACESQSNVQSGDSSSTVTQQDCTDQVVPPEQPQKALPAIPSQGVQITPDQPQPSAPQPEPLPFDPPPKAAAPPPKAAEMPPAKPPVTHSHKAAAKRPQQRPAKKSQNLPMFWWHTHK